MHTDPKKLRTQVVYLSVLPLSELVHVCTIFVRLGDVWIFVLLGTFGQFYMQLPTGLEQLIALLDYPASRLSF